MQKHCAFLFFIFISFYAQSQTKSTQKDTTETVKDSIKKTLFLKQLGNGYLPIGFFNLDLRYLVKYNQYEAFRTGLGGVTNDKLSKKFHINGYLVHGFGDEVFKYSLGVGFKVSSKTNTWVDAAYTDDLQETGSSLFLTDKRFFQLFEPRLLNISLFHKHITKTLSLSHQVSNKLLSETQLGVSEIDPTYQYTYVINDGTYQNFNLSTLKISLQWSPFSDYKFTDKGLTETKEAYPKLTLQYTKGIKGVLEGDFDFSKIDFRTIYKIKHKNTSISEANITAGIAMGNTPLTHLYHAYPNNINKETLASRFSVASINGFETMYFNEFFSDKFITAQFKHFLRPFNISPRYKPQLVFITRLAVGNMDHKERHQNITFGTLNKGYYESGIELNKLFFGFGLSFSYRYGVYHLPRLEDNLALKFTFNITL